ncbi:hypothetical protein PVAND_005302 [Polypedilum vanderplanki]|uniref:EGF-like domain-containing protein n=1 Tax=Polypedilum vanderplanki TaxID=319348 RepID=A0A9J6C062_POLVA|nr:hypothetical protein PVAND_005302 [Polypedilum vanderplanki]
MINLKWIYLTLALCVHLFSVTLSQDFVFPESDENNDPFQSIRSNWQIKTPSNVLDKGVKSVKTFFSTSSRSSDQQPVQEPLATRILTYQSGSGSSAQANSGSMNFGSGMSGSGSSANAGSMSFGSGGGMGGSGSSANAGSKSFYQPSAIFSYGGSGSSANSGSMNYGFSPANLQSVGGSSSSANAGSSSFNFQPGVMQSYGGSGSSANAGSMSFGSGLQSGGSGSFSQAGSSSFSMSGKQCTQRPQPPANAGMKCSQSACQITCLADYKFPNGEMTMTLECNNGRWLVKSLELNEMPPCEPICLPKCLNNGICVAPGQCKCPENYMGPTCQMKKELCLASPPLPANSKRSCTSSLCTVTCMKGYKFPDASLSMNLLCKSGKWVPEKQGIQLIPDCEPVCDSPCLNGGTCLSYNVCQCTANYRGAQCQYSIERCLPKKLNFNGAYNCTSTGDFISCKLYCPKGISFDFEPASVYTCSYAVGEFMPKQVPTCVYGEGMQVVQLAPTGKIEYSQTNGTLKKQSSGKKIIKQEIDYDDGDEEEEIEETIIKKTKVIKKKKKTKNIVEEEDEEFFQHQEFISFI